MTWRHRMDPISKIREKSREQWFCLAKSYVDEIRIWIEDNGIKASALALVFGMIIILFFKLFVFLLVLSALVTFFIWSVALPENGSNKKMDKPPVSANGRARSDSNGDTTH